LGDKAMKKLKELHKKLFKYGFNSYGAFRVGKVKQMTRAPFVILKKHYCSSCNGKLEISWVTQMIHEGTPEAKKKNLLFGFDGKPVQYTFAIFECNKCGNKLSINDQYYVENPKKLKKDELNQCDYRLTDDYHSYLVSLRSRDK
jgi:hypothetical protein